MMKRFLDITLSAAALVVLSPLLAVIAIATAILDGWPVLFTQERIGKGFERFTLLKFRTMDTTGTGPQITSTGDERITRVGHFLRSTKLDELPQLVNVMRGDMSLVGPRPEVPKYVEAFRDDFAIILSVRPGITGAASVAFRNESEVLGRAQDPEQLYVKSILPDKIAMEIDYVATRSMAGDFRILADTIAGIFS